MYYKRPSYPEPETKVVEINKVYVRSHYVLRIECLIFLTSHLFVLLICKHSYWKAYEKNLELQALSNASHNNNKVDMTMLAFMYL